MDRPVALDGHAKTSVSAVVAFALLAIVYSVRLGAGSLWDNSEPQYGEIVKEMLRSGDWLTLHKDTLPWFIHPPLWFWVTAVSAKLFGLTEFALRLPSALFGLACAGTVYAAARRLFGEAAGVVAMLALGTSLEMLVLGRLAIQDTMLIFFMTVTGFWSFFAIRDGDVRAFWIATIAAALGTLVKGPVAPLLPLLTLLAWAAWTNRWSAMRALPWISASLVFIVVAGSWFAVETAINGSRFLYAYFGLSNVGRFLSPFENQPGPWYFYLPIAIVGFFPFIVFVPTAAVRAWRTLGNDGKYLIAAFVVPLVFFSIAQTKLPNYIAVGFPALAVMVGEQVGNAVRSPGGVATLRRPMLWLAVALVILLAGTEFTVLHGSARAVAPYAGLLVELVGSVAVIGIATALVMPLVRRAWVAPWGLAAMMTAFILIVAGQVLPDVEATAKPMKAMAADLMERWQPGTRICFDGVKQGFSLDYYTDGPPVKSIGHNTDDTPPAAFFHDPSPALCVVSPDAYAALSTEGFRLEVLERTPTLWLAYRTAYLY